MPLKKRHQKVFAPMVSVLSCLLCLSPFLSLLHVPLCKDIVRRHPKPASANQKGINREPIHTRILICKTLRNICLLFKFQVDNILSQHPNLTETQTAYISNHINIEGSRADSGGHFPRGLTTSQKFLKFLKSSYVLHSNL